MKKMRCFDQQTNVAYPEHQWNEDGQCTRCWRWQPGIRHDDKPTKLTETDPDLISYIKAMKKREE